MADDAEKILVRLLNGISDALQAYLDRPKWQYCESCGGHGYWKAPTREQIGRTQTCSGCNGKGGRYV